MSASLFHSLSYLDLLPVNLYVPVVKHHNGDFELRCLGVVSWYELLMKGQLPISFSEVLWPVNIDFNLLLSELKKSRIVTYCENNTARAEQLILDMLQWLDHQDSVISFSEINSNDELDEPSPEISTSNDVQKQESQTSSEQDNTQILSEQEDDDHASSNQSLDDFNWQAQPDVLDEMSSLMQDYSVERRLGWDFSTGMLARTEWKQILQIHKKLKRSVYLKNIIALIGRNETRSSKSSDQLSESIVSPSNISHTKNTLSDQVPVEAAGITRSDDIGRMLASELMALGHKKLKMLWHARRAEGVLLSYRFEGVLSEHVPVMDAHKLSPDETSNESLNVMGPMIICLDSSASMKGKAEQVAKAIVFETMRLAHKMNRSCILFVFSGPGEIHQYELNHSEHGWRNILDMISLSFHGGTDVTQIVHRVLQLINDESWQQADALLLSDSRFDVDETLQKSLISVQQATGLRLHGINVSRWKSASMEKICQPLYRITDI